MWTNDKKRRDELTEKYVFPHVEHWNDKGIEPSLDYYYWRLEDGSRRLTDVLTCKKCGNSWKDNLYDYKECPYCNGTSISRGIPESFKKKVINHVTNKKLQKDECVIFNTLSNAGYIQESQDENIPQSFIVNYKHEGTNLESDFYFPTENVTIECQGEQHFSDVDIKDDPLKTNSDRRIMLFEQVIRDVYKFNVVFKKRVLYYVNQDNILCDEITFEQNAIKEIMSHIKNEIETNPTGILNSINKYKQFGYIDSNYSVDDIVSYIEQSLNEMYMKKNRTFKSPIELCNVLSRIIGAPSTLF